MYCVSSFDYFHDVLINVDRRQDIVLLISYFVTQLVVLRRHRNPLRTESVAVHSALVEYFACSI